MHLGTPCSSFSRARRGVPGSPGGPLRTKQFPSGLPGLPHDDDHKVNVGNTLASFSAEVVKTCLKQGTLCSLENPRFSFLWDFPDIENICRYGEAALFDFCCFGTAWKKPTKFMFWNSFGTSSINRLCQTSLEGGHKICSRTGRRHQILEGKAPGGKSWTCVAEPYPHRLVKHLCNHINEMYDPLPSSTHV